MVLVSAGRCDLVSHGTVSKETLPTDNSLIEIDLFQCNITNVKDSAFSNLNQLLILVLQHNSITEIRQNTFTGLSNLYFMDLDGNQINCIEDGALNLPKLNVLSFRENQLTTLSDTVFSQLPSLKYIDLSWNKLKHIGKSLYSLQTVTDIHLCHNKIVDIDLKEFAKLSALHQLSLLNCSFDWTAQADVTDDFITSVNPSLNKLDVSNNNITDPSFINKLKMFKNLEDLVTEKNPFEEITWDASTIKEAFPNLRWIILGKIELDRERMRDLRRAFEAKDIRLRFLLD